MSHDIFIVEGVLADDFDEIHKTDLQVRGGGLCKLHNELHELSHAVLLRV